ncbi:amino acid permease [Jatrophihabitans telluris]|uniref:Amino acid permease n=1 Tax=Jatrophihabitans telluris TaxID=2038343 RepID=A0ABY4QXM8_9ACTN|nr:amino acid permease [Jatrophihabitans telluris]UQX88265.1 amino acid permease [Jatrophihabitans telluris]
MTDVQAARKEQLSGQAAAPALTASISLPERLSYRVKRVLLGPPLVSSQMHEEKLSKRLALGVLSSDCISSSAYGTEEMLIILLGVFGLAGFHILAPMTAVILVILVLMTLSYREVVMVYTRAGGSYVVCRENFGYKMAQVAAVALLIDYIVTVAVQTAAAVAAITSGIHGLIPYKTEICIVLIILLAYGNLRGIKEAGQAFAFPTYFFFISVTVVIVIGVGREIFGDLPKYGLDRVVGGEHQLPIVDGGHPILSGLAIFYLLKAFANGGASLTGLEAISDGVSAFQAPNGPNARRTLGIMSAMLAFLVIGIGYLSMQTHAAPFHDGTPTVISQVVRASFGEGTIGHIGFVIVQFATALILITGANTPFTGFPFLANFVAEDSFLPRQLTRRGHRLAFSNGIFILTFFSIVLLIAGRANVDKLVPFYSLGVFTGFTLAGFGMAKYHTIHKEAGWKKKWWINASGGALSLAIVLITAVVKFTEGAWVVLVVAPLLWLLLMRLNQQYRAEARSLDLVTSSPRFGKGGSAHYARHVVLVFVDRLDLAVVRALRYAGSLRPTELRAVHISLDDERAKELEREWIERGLGDRVPLEIVECPDRRLIRAASETALGAVVGERAEVTVLLPRRTFRRLSQRLLHDRTADRIANAMAKIPHVSATIVPFDTTLDEVQEQELERQRAKAEKKLAMPTLDAEAPDHVGAPEIEPTAPGEGTGAVSPTRAPEPSGRGEDEASTEPEIEAEPDENGVIPIAGVKWKQRVTIQGRIKIVQVGTTAGKSLEAQVFDETGGMRLLFFGRTRIPGIEPGSVVRVSGTVGEYKGHLALANPRYELLPAESGTKT